MRPTAITSVGFDECDLALEVSCGSASASSGLGSRLSGGRHFRTFAMKTSSRAKPSARIIDVEQLARAADERFALPVLLHARRFADEHPPRAWDCRRRTRSACASQCSAQRSQAATAARNASQSSPAGAVGARGPQLRDGRGSDRVACDRTDRVRRRTDRRCDCRDPGSRGARCRRRATSNGSGRVARHVHVDAQRTQISRVCVASVIDYLPGARVRLARSAGDAATRRQTASSGPGTGVHREQREQHLGRTRCRPARNRAAPAP